MNFNTLNFKQDLKQNKQTSSKSATFSDFEFEEWFIYLLFLLLSSALLSLSLQTAQPSKTLFHFNLFFS